MALPDTNPLDWWVTELSYGGRPPFAYLRQTQLNHDREKVHHLYTAHFKVSDRVWIRSFHTRHQALLFASWHAGVIEQATKATPAEARRVLAGLPPEVDLLR